VSCISNSFSMPIFLERVALILDLVVVFFFFVKFYIMLLCAFNLMKYEKKYVNLLLTTMLSVVANQLLHLRYVGSPCIFHTPTAIWHLISQSWVVGFLQWYIDVPISPACFPLAFVDFAVAIEDSTRLVVGPIPW
jgi:hypothetical protein